MVSETFLDSLTRAGYSVSRVPNQRYTGAYFVRHPDSGRCGLVVITPLGPRLYVECKGVGCVEAFNAYLNTGKLPDRK